MNITVLITNYNYAPFLREAVQSIANQTIHGDFAIRLLIGDDASTDSSKEVIQSIRRDFSGIFEKIEVIQHTHNHGKLSLLNTMIPLVQTPLATILDADDWLSPEFLSCSLAHFIRHFQDPRFGFVYSNCNLISREGSYLGEGRSTSFCPALIKESSYLPQTALMRTSALKSGSQLNESIRVGTKHHQWNKICEAGWYGVHIPKPLFNYRLHSSNMSGIGAKILSQEANAVKSRLLEGYWPKAQAQGL